MHRDRQLRALGPDALDPEVRPDTVLRRMRHDDPSRPFADALRDQRLMAGPGLTYAGEGPAAAGVNPLQPLGTIADDDLLTVICATSELMRRVVLTGRRPRTVQSRKGKPGYPRADRG